MQELSADFCERKIDISIIFIIEINADFVSILLHHSHVQQLWKILDSYFITAEVNRLKDTN